jgi:hypothetical protein
MKTNDTYVNDPSVESVQNVRRMLFINKTRRTQTDRQAKHDNTKRNQNESKLTSMTVGR